MPMPVKHGWHALRPTRPPSTTSPRLSPGQPCQALALLGCPRQLCRQAALLNHRIIVHCGGHHKHRLRGGGRVWEGQAWLAGQFGGAAGSQRAEQCNNSQTSLQPRQQAMAYHRLPEISNTAPLWHPPA